MDLKKLDGLEETRWTQSSLVDSKQPGGLEAAWWTQSSLATCPQWFQFTQRLFNFFKFPLHPCTRDWATIEIESCT
ncbi:hypothetical protein EYF80_032484 [Liparis tanakae]|uniref:Uncharacterized protein n=1 Tax=Liparis tanakae TaxID=230148 RepID=A0A4Z2GW21_9TELE|nr:hypothetical protein EYF80_032484 [Liparis tanakae]